MTKKYPVTCPVCDGGRTEQQPCNQCRGGGCGNCNNGYITITCRRCNGAGTV